MGGVWVGGRQVLDLVVKDWCERERVCYVWQKGRFIPYPYQNNIHRSVPAEALRLVRSSAALVLSPGST